MGVFKAFKKAGVFVVGGTVVIIGVILLPLPGPGMLIIAGGLLILSTEFDWAERHLAVVKSRLQQLLDKTRPKTKKKQK